MKLTHFWNSTAQIEGLFYLWWVNETLNFIFVYLDLKTIMISSSKIKNKWNLYVFEAQKCHELFVMHSFFSETKFVETDRIDIATLQKKNYSWHCN